MKGDIVKIENSDELQKKLRSETDGGVKIRLIFLNALSNLGISYDEASEICGLSTSTGYVWIRKWNKGGYEALTGVYKISPHLRLCVLLLCRV